MINNTGPHSSVNNSYAINSASASRLESAPARTFQMLTIRPFAKMGQRHGPLGEPPILVIPDLLRPDRRRARHYEDGNGRAKRAAHHSHRANMLPGCIATVRSHLDLL